MLQSLVGPLQSERRSTHDFAVVCKGAALTTVHLFLGISLLGPVGYAMCLGHVFEVSLYFMLHLNFQAIFSRLSLSPQRYSVGMSSCLTLLTAPVHDAKGVQSGVDGYYARQVAATANIAEHDNPLIRYFMMGALAEQLGLQSDSRREHLD